VETYFWMTIALPKLKGDMLINAQHIRDFMITKLTPAERTKADERILAWKTAHSRFD